MKSFSLRRLYEKSCCLFAILVFPVLVFSPLSAVADTQTGFSWARGMGGTLSDFGISIAVDSEENVYTAGNFRDTVEFAPGLPVIPSNGENDVFLSKWSKNGEFLWVLCFGSTSFDDVAALVLDQTDNIYLTGGFNGTVDFNPGPGTTSLTSSGNADIFVVKFSPDGTLVWAKSFAGLSSKSPQAIAVDSSGNVYTTGGFSGSVDFDPGVGTSPLVGEPFHDVFVSKLDSNGNLLWATMLGGASQDTAHGIGVDLSGNVFISGQFEGTADFDPGAGVAERTSAGSEDIFLCKLDSNGGFVGVEAIGNSARNISNDLVVDTLGHVYLTGEFEGEVDFDPGVDTHSLISHGGTDIFVCKFSNALHFTWASGLGGANSDTGRAIVVDSLGNVYTTGDYWQSGDFDPGPEVFTLTGVQYEDIFISKLDSNGDFLSARSIGGSSGDYGRDIHTDSSGSIYLTGDFRETADFDPGEATFELTSNGGEDIYIVKLGSIKPVVPDFYWPMFLPALVN